MTLVQRCPALPSRWWRLVRRCVRSSRCRTAATTLAVWSCVGRVSCGWREARAACAAAAGGSVVSAKHAILSQTL
jgi:hypothetical protein